MKPETKEKITLAWMWVVAGVTTIAIAATVIAYVVGIVLYTFNLIRRIYG